MIQMHSCAVIKFINQMTTCFHPANARRVQCTTAMPAYIQLLSVSCHAHRFPGPEAVYDKLFDCVDVNLLMEAAKFCAETPAAHNHAFNVVSNCHRPTSGGQDLEPCG